MSEKVQIGMEIVFNIAYLVTIWFMVFRMYSHKHLVLSKDRETAKNLLWAFALLALGDTGHVGFRVIAYAKGGLEQNGSLVGYGALATAVTVTLFYVLVLEMWRVRYRKAYGLIGGILLAAAAVRIILMLFPQNSWNSVVPPADWSLYRNLPLMVQGIGIALLILVSSIRAKDRAFTWVAAMIFLSYACYMPVIFLVQKLPLIGMLMIPKTMAYVAIAFIGYYSLYKDTAAEAVKKSIAG